MPTASNYLCGCGRFLVCKKNSVTVEELDEQGAPLRLWDADQYECPECGMQIISGFGRAPMLEAWHPDYVRHREHLAPIYPGRCR
jgi:hypothetical protein